MKPDRLTADQEHAQFVKHATAQIESKVDAVHSSIQVGSSV
jgi:hypothetical protein